MGASFIINPLNYHDIESLAELHKKSFTIGWDSDVFYNFLADKNYFGFGAKIIGNAKKLAGFIIVRAILNEAEIITIAVDQKLRNQAIGHSLLQQTILYLKDRNTAKIFLEVDENNLAAQKLYKKFNFCHIATRNGYYKDDKKRRSNAFILCYNFA